VALPDPHAIVSFAIDGIVSSRPLTGLVDLVNGSRQRVGLSWRRFCWRAFDGDGIGA
jgi:hypothetical protein